MKLIPLTTEKAVMKIEGENILTFVTEKKENRESIKKEIEEIFEIKVEKIRTTIRKNKKYVYAKLTPENLAIDVATKLGMM
jgi:large subunit ribosomal protein L23